MWSVLIMEDDEDTDSEGSSSVGVGPRLGLRGHLLHQPLRGDGGREGVPMGDALSSHVLAQNS